MSFGPSRRLPDMDHENVSATLAVAAPAATVFTVLADPMTHAAMDGTGRVQEPLDREPLSEVGQVFRMNMYHPDHPDGNYRTANKLHVFDFPRAIGWYTGYDPKGDGQLEFGGWFWRYDLAPLSLSETEVTLTYDWSQVPQRIREYINFPPFGPEHFTDSLRHLAELAAPLTPPGASESP